jgi:putative oxidoreductase
VTLLASPRVQLVLRLLLGAFFVYASLDKIASPAGFAKIVYQWQVAGPVPSNLVAVTLPWVELVAGLLLIAGVWRREAALVVALMLVVFLGAAASVLARGIDVQNCGCVSVAKEAVESAWPPAWTKGVGWFLIVRNLLMLAAALAIAFVKPAPAESEAGQRAPAGEPSRV